MKLAYTVTSPDAKDDPVLAWNAPLEESLPVLAKLGYDGLELMVRNPEAIHTGQLKELLRKHGLSVPIIGTGPIALGRNLSLSASNDEIRLKSIEAIRAALQLCASLGALLNIGQFRGIARDPSELKGNRDRFADSLRTLLPEAEKLRVRIAIEPQNRFQSTFLRTTAESLEFIQRLGSDQLGLVLDTFHMNIEESDFEIPFRIAADRLFHIHFAENHRGAPGTGHIPFERILKILKEINYDGWISIEIVQEPTPIEAAQSAIKGLLRIKEKAGL
jgi:sugar phosphate isomerase/epimerase